MIKLLWAMDKNKLIGKDNHLPWHIKEELQHFKSMTLNKTILLGRITFEGIGKSLSNRKILILTNNLNYKYDHVGVEVIYDLQKVIQKYQYNLVNDLIVCGGSKIYQEILPYADNLIVSYIKGKYFGDTYFPKFNWNDFKLYKVEEHSKFIIKYYKRKG